MDWAMFGLGDKIRSAAAFGGTMALAVAIALLGLVWLSIAAVTAMTAVMPPIAAMCIVGVLAMAPLAFVLLRAKPPRPAPQPESQAPDAVAAAIVRLAHSAQLMGERAPAAGIALTLGAAFLAARSPATSPLAIHMLAEAVERWLSSQAPRDEVKEETKDEAPGAHETFTGPR